MGVSLIALASLLVAVTSASADVVADDAAIDFGTVEQGAAVDRSFQLRNRGSEPVQILGVKGTCACTVGASTGRVLAPGEATWVSVRLDTSRLTGRTTKRVTVHTTDPSTPTVALGLTGDVVTDVVVEPDRVYTGRLRRGEGVRHELRVRSGRAAVAHVATGVESSNPGVRAVLDDPGDGRGQRIVVQVSPDLPRGRFHGDLTIHTTGTAQPRIVVPVFGSVEGGAGDGG